MGSGATWARHGEGGSNLPPSFHEAKVVETRFDRSAQQRGSLGSLGAFLSSGSCCGLSRIEWLRAFVVLCIGFCLGAATAMALTGEFGGPRIITGM